MSRGKTLFVGGAAGTFCFFMALACGGVAAIAPDRLHIVENSVFATLFALLAAAFALALTGVWRKGFDE